MAFAPFKVHPADKQPTAGARLHTFNIRFGRSRGLAGFFEAPSNEFGWKGAGSLTIDAKGVGIAVRRGFRRLFSRAPRRFSADSLIEAYREGNSLRLVFRAKDKSKLLPVWTEGGDQAAELVKLLPTLRTVEIDHSTLLHRYRPDWSSIALVALVLMLVVGASLSLLPGSTESSEPFEETGDPGLPSKPSGAMGSQASSVGDPARATPSRPGGATGIVAASTNPRRIGLARPGRPESKSTADVDDVERPSPASSPAYPAASPVAESEAVSPSHDYFDAARWMLQDFEAQSGKGIDDEGWWSFTVRLHTTPEFQQRELWAVREAMLAVSRAWRAHDVEFAEELTGQVHMLIREAL